MKRSTLTFFLVVFCPSLTLSQTAAGKTESPTARKNAARTETAPPKLTSDQERGLRLLRAAEAEAGGLAPDMHAYVLWRASLAYAKVDPKKAESVTAEVFTATQAIEDSGPENHCAPTGTGSVGDIKAWIQERILTAMVEKQKIAEAEQLLPQAIEPVRNQITKQLIQYYAKQKNFDHAVELLAHLADTNQYPFDAAGDVILEMGPERSADAMTIFNQAIANSEQQKQKQMLGPGDIGDFIERTWTKVPAAMVLEAINKLLEDAKSNDSKSHYGMTSASGHVVLNSGYEMRLFQLLPVLQELDEEKAEKLLRDETELKAKLTQYPQGMQSLKRKGDIYSFGVTDSDAPQASEVVARDQVAAQMSERVNRVRNEAGVHPDQALADALALPVSNGSDSSPRANALLLVAQAAAVKNPRIAKSALDELWKTQDQWPLQQAARMTDVPGVYLKLGDQEGAKKAVSALVKAAQKLYEWDVNADDPNKAFKGTWPSTDLWRKCVQTAAKISPAMAEEIIANIQDPDIAAAEKIAFASSLIGAGGADVTMVSDCRKNYAGFSTSVSN